MRLVTSRDSQQSGYHRRPLPPLPSHDILEAVEVNRFLTYRGAALVGDSFSVTFVPSDRVLGKTRRA